MGAEAMVARLEVLADKVDTGVAWKAVWPGLHACCEPADGGYPGRIGDLFAALRDEVDCRYQTYLGAVLKIRHRDGALGEVLREAARRLSDRAVPA